MRPAELSLGRLRSRLIDGGVAPGRVRRLLDELRSHHEDLFADALRGNMDPQEAAQSARERLGDEELLARQMLAQPGLLSWSRRRPWAIYAVGPLLVYPLALAAMCVLIMAFGTVLHRLGNSSPRTFLQVLQSLRFFSLYAMPALLTAGMLVVAARRRVAYGWALLSVVILACLGSLTNVDVSLHTLRAGIGVNLHLHAMVGLLLTRFAPNALAGGALGVFWTQATRGRLRSLSHAD